MHDEFLTGVFSLTKQLTEEQMKYHLCKYTILDR